MARWRGESNKSTQQSEPGKGSGWSIDKLTSGLNGLQKKFDGAKQKFNAEVNYATTQAGAFKTRVEDFKTQADALKKQATGFFGTQSDQATPHGKYFDNDGYRRLSLRGSTHN